MKVSFRPTPAANDIRQHGIQVPYGPGKREPIRRKAPLFLVVMGGAFLFFVGRTTFSALVATVPAQLRIGKVPAVASLSGIASAVLVSPGDSVEAGQRLVALRDPSVETKRALIDKELASLAEQSGKGQSGKGGERVTESLRRVVEAAEAELGSNQARSERLSRLFERGFALSGEVAESKAAVARSRVSVARARADYEAARSGGDRATAPRRAELMGERAHLEAIMEGLAVKSPQAGTVDQVLIREGDSVEQGQKVAVVRYDPKPRVEAYVEPERLAVAAPGTTVTVVFPNGEVRDGVVSETGSVAETPSTGGAGTMTRGRTVVRVIVELSEDPPPDMLIQDLPVQVRFPVRFFGIRIG